MATPRIFRRALPGALLLALLVPAASAQASASLVTPTDGAKVGTRPGLAWTPGTGETTSAVNVSYLPFTDDQGRLGGESSVFETLTTNSLAVDHDLYARQYWWQVETVPTGSDLPRMYSSVRTFTVLPRIFKPRLQVRRLSGLHITIVTVTWRGNLLRPSTVLDIYRGHKRVFHEVHAHANGALDGELNTAKFTAVLPNIKAGTPLRAVGTATGTGIRKKTTVAFKAP
jgi:hypothetical protein